VPTAIDVAEWMVRRLEEVGFLYQEDISWEIRTEFGEEFTYVNDNGNIAISRSVLDKFRRLTGDSVVWERGERMWRKRRSFDCPGRMQD
jgi:hypothetical protein